MLYDGSPLHPQTDTMWDLVDECGITVFGTSAKWIAVQEDRMVRLFIFKFFKIHRYIDLKRNCSKMIYLADEFLV